MKKFKKILIGLVILFSFCTFVNASCNNEELNEWATKVEPKFIEITDIGMNSSEYAYLLTIDPLREDITIKVTDGVGGTATAKKLTPAPGKADILAVGCYTNLEEETYTIEVYGAKDSACPNQLLKTLKYTVPRFNRYIKDARCEGEGANSELCKTFTNATENMSESDFQKALDKDIQVNQEPTFLQKVLNVILNYGLYIIIPLVIISVFYGIRIKKYKKEERDR